MHFVNVSLGFLWNSNEQVLQFFIKSSEEDRMRWGLFCGGYFGGAINL